MVNKGKSKLVMKDAIHDVVTFENEELCRDIIDTEYMQRLRLIKQLGVTNLVFPDAEHSRFQHSKGVMYLAKTIATNLGLSNEEIELVEAAGLLHDVGVYPLSHSLEKADFGYIYNLNHGKTTARIIQNSIISDIVSSYGISPKSVASIATTRTHPLSYLINGPLDADKIDYLQRDAHFTGVPVEIDRYLYHAFVRPSVSDVIHISEKGVFSAESVFSARYRLTKIAYEHHAVRAARLMLNRAAIDAIERNKITESNLIEIGDADLFNKLCDAGGYSEQLATRLKVRKLFKRVCELPTAPVRNEFLRKYFCGYQSLFATNRMNIVRLETYLAEKMDQSPGSLLLDIPHPNEFLPPERDALVWTGKKPSPSIVEYSKYAEQITNGYKDLEMIRVFSETRLKPGARRKCAELLRNVPKEFPEGREIQKLKPWIGQRIKHKILSNICQKILDFVQDKDGCYIREVSEEFGLPLSDAVFYLDDLRRKGYLRRRRKYRKTFFFGVNEHA